MKDKDFFNVLGCGLVLVSFTLLPFTSILNGWVLCQLWRWFVIPTFELPQLSIPIAIGIACIINFLTYHYQTSSTNATDFDEAQIKALLSYILFVIFRPFIVLGFAWIVFQFV